MNELNETKEETKAYLMCTVKMYDGPPYGEFTIEPKYKARGGEQKILKEIVDVLKKWRNEA